MPHFEITIVAPVELPIELVGLVRLPLGIKRVVGCKKVYHSFDFEEHSAPSIWGVYDHSVVRKFEFDLYCTDCEKVVGIAETEIKNFRLDLSKNPDGCTLVDQEDPTSSTADFVLPGQCDPCSRKVYNSEGEEITSDTESEPSYENGRI